MFDRFIRLARARKSLREGRFLDVLEQAADPVVEADRRAERLRLRAADEVLRRAERRLAEGYVDDATRDARRLQQLMPSAAVEDLLARCEAAAAQRAEAAAAQRAATDEFRALVDSGALSRAESLVATLPEDAPGVPGMRAELATRRRRAASLLAEAADHAGAGRCEPSVEAYRQSLAVDDAPVGPAHASARRQLAEALRDQLGAALPSRGGGAPAALASYADATRRLPSLREEAALGELIEAFVEAARERLRQVEELSEGARLGLALQDAGVSLGETEDRAVAELVAAERSAASGAPAPASLAQFAATAGFAGLAQRAAAASAAASGLQQQLAAARALLERGELEQARERFVAVLSEDPLHADARREVEQLDEALADLDRRLADARTALRSGRLREVCTLAMALTGAARVAAEAQRLAGEARDRMALVERGVDEVRVALHGRASGSLESLRHCLGRLRELGRVQVDHEQLQALIASVQAEIESLERCATVLASLSGGDLAPVARAVPELVAVRGRLLHAERIDARLAEVGDAVQRHGEQALESGRLGEVERAAALLAQLAEVRGAFGEQAAAWRAAREERAEGAQALLSAARELAAAGDRAGAARELEAARSLWRDSDEVRAWTERLRRTRRQESTLSEAAAMARDQDFAGAQEKLAGIADVDPSLRTRVYDIRRDLVRAQGLEGPFLLRVDEGGEHLVVRGESLTIGNVRHGRADLPILASLAGRHASIRRSMSFHGGMEDAVVAEEGEVRVGGHVVQRRALAAGDVVQLGGALRARYERPTARSLTSRLVLEGGFQVAGTERVLLMKDRGRDGRILIGQGRDVHVPVEAAEGEVAIYAHSSGQIRVVCEQGGAIDGVAFAVEHPLAAGEVVEAAGVTLVLMPWTHPRGSASG